MTDDLPEAAEETIAAIEAQREAHRKKFREVTDTTPDSVACDRCDSETWESRSRQRTPVAERTGFEHLCPRCEVAVLVDEGHRFGSGTDDSADESPAEQTDEPDETPEPTPTPSGETAAATLGDFA